MIPEGYTVRIDNAIINWNNKTAVVDEQYYKNIEQLSDPNNPPICEIGKIIVLTDEQMENIRQILLINL